MADVIASEGAVDVYNCHSEFINSSLFVNCATLLIATIFLLVMYQIDRIFYMCSVRAFGYRRTKSAKVG